MMLLIIIVMVKVIRIFDIITMSLAKSNYVFITSPHIPPLIYFTSSKQCSCQWKQKSNNFQLLKTAVFSVHFEVRFPVCAKQASDRIGNVAK